MKKLLLSGPDVTKILDALHIESKPEGSKSLSIRCPLHQDRNPSARVDRGDGEHPVGFRCFSCGESGSLARLVGIVQGWDEEWPRIYDWMREVLGRPQEEAAPKKKREPPPKESKPVDQSHVEKWCAALQHATDVLEWLERRGLTPEIVKRARLGFWIDRQQREWITIPMPNKSVRVRAWNTKNGQPKYRFAAKGSKTCLYPRVPDDVAELEVVVVEAELDALLLRRLGFHAFATCGASSWSWAFCEPLFAAKKVYLLPDRDESGQKAGEQLMREAAAHGMHPKTYLLVDGGEGPKDPGELFEAAGEQGCYEAIKKLIDEAEPAPEPSWVDLLERTKEGNVRNSVLNHEIIFENDPQLASLWMNARSRRVMIGERPLEDADIQDIKVHVYREHGITIGTDAADSQIRATARRRSRDLVVEHLDSLPKWDGTERLDRMVGTILLTPQDPQPIERVYVRKWMIQAVRRALERGCKAEQVLILISELQGVGKSTFGRILAGEDFFTDMYVSPYNKDGKVACQAYWIVELAELDASFEREKSASAWRHFISVQEDVERRSYARHPEVFQRGFVFLATTNRKHIIREDDARRYWPLEVTEVDLDLLREQRDQLLAEALHACRQGEPHHLDKSQEDQRRDLTRQEYHEQNELADVLESVLEFQTLLVDRDAEGFQMEEIVLWMREAGLLVKPREIGSALRELGFKKITARTPLSPQPSKRWFPPDGFTNAAHSESSGF